MDSSNRENLKDLFLTSKEVLDILGIKRARLSQLIKKGKIFPVKKNIFLTSDILERKKVQEELRLKYYRPKYKV